MADNPDLPPQYGQPHGEYEKQYGPPQNSPYGPPQTSPYGPPQTSPYGPPQTSPYGQPYHQPYGQPHTTVVTTQPNVMYIQPIPPPPNSYMVLSVISCLFCVWPIGLAAIIFASQSSDAARSGNLERARSKGKIAMGLSIASICLGGALVVILLIIRFTVGFGGYYYYYG